MSKLVNRNAEVNLIFNSISENVRNNNLVSLLQIVGDKFPLACHAIYHSTIQGSLEIVELLLQKFPRTIDYIHSKTKFNLLQTAVLFNHSILVKLYTKKAPKLMQVDLHPPLHLAASLGRLEDLKWMINEFSANINDLNKAGETLLHAAVASVSSLIPKELANNSIFQIEQDKLAVLKFLLEAEIDINRVDHNGVSAIVKTYDLELGNKYAMFATLAADGAELYHSYNIPEEFKDLYCTTRAIDKICNLIYLCKEEIQALTRLKSNSPIIYTELLQRINFNLVNKGFNKPGPDTDFNKYIEAFTKYSKEMSLPLDITGRVEQVVNKSKEIFAALENSFISEIEQEYNSGMGLVQFINLYSKEERYLKRLQKEGEKDYPDILNFYSKLYKDSPTITSLLSILKGEDQSLDPEELEKLTTKAISECSCCEYTLTMQSSNLAKAMYHNSNFAEQLKKTYITLALPQRVKEMIEEAISEYHHINNSAIVKELVEQNRTMYAHLKSTDQIAQEFSQESQEMSLESDRDVSGHSTDYPL